MNIRNERLIAIAVGVLVLGAPLVLIALEFPETTKNVLLDATMLPACVLLWQGLYDSPGYRNLVIGVFGLPIGFFALNEVVGDLVSVLAVIGFAGWLVVGLVRKQQVQMRIVRYLAGVAATWLGFAAVVPLMDPGNKVHVALALMLVTALYLAWRTWLDPKPLVSSKPPDPWRWSRDKDGNWRA